VLFKLLVEVLAYTNILEHPLQLGRILKTTSLLYFKSADTSAWHIFDIGEWEEQSIGAHFLRRYRVQHFPYPQHWSQL